MDKFEAAANVLSAVSMLYEAETEQSKKRINGLEKALKELVEIVEEHIQLTCNNFASDELEAATAVLSDK